MSILGRPTHPLEWCRTTRQRTPTTSYGRLPAPCLGRGEHHSHRRHDSRGCAGAWRKTEPRRRVTRRVPSKGCTTLLWDRCVAISSLHCRGVRWKRHQRPDAAGTKQNSCPRFVCRARCRNGAQRRTPLIEGRHAWTYEAGHEGRQVVGVAVRLMVTLERTLLGCHGSSRWLGTLAPPTRGR